MMPLLMLKKNCKSHKPNAGKVQGYSCETSGILYDTWDVKVKRNGVWKWEVFGFRGHIDELEHILSVVLH